MYNLFLSKSSYCKSIQCPKIIWLKKYKPDEAVQFVNPKVFENGKKVGILAQDLFGNKHDDIKYTGNYRGMIEKTREFLEKKPNIITEASFDYDHNFCMVDILKNDEDGVEIYEVKSSTKINEIYYDDASFQYYILSNLGLNVKKVCIIYINNQYVRGKELELDKLFNIQDITNIAIAKQDEISNNIIKINNFMAEHDKNKEPNIALGKHCSKPYKCDFCEYCNKIVEKRNITPGQQQLDMYMTDNKLIINKEAIKDLLDSLKYPLYFIDYETYNTPIPEIEGTKPYQQLPFQYSLHILENEDAELEHKQFLAQIDDENFIRHFTESMIINITEKGSIIVYNKSFEKNVVNNQLIRMYPDLEDKITRINDNMIDFMEPFRKKYYYTKEMNNSYSIKSVLPALYPDEPELDYSKLPYVHEGEEASDAFISLKDKSPEEQVEIREGLLKYCHLDTYAMVKIYEKFKEIVNDC
ncbi:MAG: DUF2779 domain-containing protein [Methanosphaera stadtmanae]|nr:DUF2779 domain-containing protein [Methanosphaera stadtmanae]